MYPSSADRWRSPAPLPPATARALHHQLVVAARALDRALDTLGTDAQALREARQALDAFELLERVSRGQVWISRIVRARVREAVHHLEREHLELARAEVSRADGALARDLLRSPGA